jgi:hypothetical protein
MASSLQRQTPPICNQSYDCNDDKAVRFYLEQHKLQDTGYVVNFFTRPVFPVPNPTDTMACCIPGAGGQDPLVDRAV